MKRLIIKLNQFKHWDWAEVHFMLNVDHCLCVFSLSFCGSLNLSVSTCLHFLVPMTPVCCIYERLAGNILFPGRKPCSAKFTPLTPFWESPVGLPKKIKIHKNIVYIKREGAECHDLGQPPFVVSLYLYMWTSLCLCVSSCHAFFFLIDVQQKQCAIHYH